MQRIILVLIFLLLVVGFIPFKFTRSLDSITENELLVDHDESTCVSDFSILKGKLHIPNEFRPYFNKQVSELTIKSNSPFNAINANHENWHILSDNQFIVSGKVIGIDSSYKNTCGNYAIFEINNWAPTNYHANFWTFSKTLFILYFLTLFTCIIISIIHLFIHKPWKRKLYIASPDLPN